MIDRAGDFSGRSSLKGEKRCDGESKSSETFIMDINYFESRTLAYI